MHLIQLVQVAAIGGAEELERLAPLETIVLPAAHESLQDDWAASERADRSKASPAITFGDKVCAFDEVSAASGSLGRFPGSELMGLLREFGGWVERVSETAERDTSEADERAGG